MCCFSGPVKSVSSTNIFARIGAEGRQYLIYSMSLDARKDVAMILPLPVKRPAEETDVHFLSLKGYPNFFADLETGFPQPPPPAGKSRSQSVTPLPNSAPLKVHEVGNFEASFVPEVKDFARLDERFRMPDGAWKDLPGYKTYGFAVFKLKAGEMNVHPMAFSFFRRDPSKLFFPTVHIHDGVVHDTAHFDHALYCQPSEAGHPSILDWNESRGHAKEFMKVPKTSGIMLANQHCYKKSLRGRLANRDTLVNVQT